MDRRNFLKVAVAAAASSPLSGLCSGGERSDRPNFVFIYIDDMGWKDVGFMGSLYYETPNIDRLAAEGMVFRDAYANAPNCAPSRACLMTGQYTPRHGIYTVGNPARGKARYRKLIPIKNETTLPQEAVTIAEELAKAGYVSASMGKWHLGDPPKHGPCGQGFDLNIGGFRAGHPPHGYFSPYRNPQLEDGPKGEYLTDRLTDHAVKFIEDNRDKPFFLYLTHYAVHTPIQGKDNLVEKYEGKPGSQGQDNPEYAAMIDSVDQSVGRVLDTLDDLDLAKNTVVVFYSDNGGVGGYRKWGIMGGEITSQQPLRGGKGMLYEGGIREPMAIRWPGVVKPGSVCDTPVIGVDFYPTMLEIAGVRKTEGKVLDGRSIVPLLTQTGDLDRGAIFWHFPAYLQAGQNTWRTTPAGAIRQGDYKLLEFFEDGRLELYNLQKDIGERHDLSSEMPEKTRELHRRLIEWRKSVNAPVPTELNPKYDP